MKKGIAVEPVIWTIRIPTAVMKRMILMKRAFSVLQITLLTMFDVLPVEHHGCFAHVLQLVVKDGFRSASQIERIINKCSKIVAHVRRSTIAKECLEGEKTLKLANATRWNSQLKMIQSILAIPSIKLDSLDVPKLSTYERNLIKEVVEILTPFEEATDFAQIEDYPSAGYVLPCIRSLKHQLANSITKPYHSSFVLSLKDSLTRRMAIYETMNDYILAAILDPRFKLLWCQDDDKKTRVKTILITEIHVAILKPLSTELDVINQETVSEPPKKKRKNFTFMDDGRNKQPTQSSFTDYKAELQKYLDDPHEEEKMCPLKYWKEHQSVYPSLAEVAITVFGIPASSAPVETPLHALLQEKFLGPKNVNWLMLPSMQQQIF